MSFTVRKLDATVVTLDDLGLSIIGPALTTFDFTGESPEQIAISLNLPAAIGVTLEVMDPRDLSIALGTTEGLEVIARANDPHWGIQGGRFEGVDDPTISPTDEFILRYNSTADAMEFLDPITFISDQSTAIGEVVGGMGVDGVDSTYTFDATATPLIASQDETSYDGGTNNGVFIGGDGVGGTAYVASDTITLGDGSVITVDAVDGNGDVTDFTVLTKGGNVTAGVLLAQSGTSGTGTGFTLTPETNNISSGTIAWDVDDVFLRNTGDTLDSGTLTIASGASLSLPTGSNIAIAGDVTIATIETPGGGFANDNDLINKEYVDSVASGLDIKESVHMCTVSDLVATYDNGTAGLGATLTATGVGVLPPSITDDHAHFVIGTRILVKSQTDEIENGLYEITDFGSGEEVSKVITTADSGDSLNGTYFEFTASNGGYYVWYKTSGGVLSDPVGTGTGIQVNIDTNDPVPLVTAATIAAINASSAAVVAYVDEADTFFIVDDAIGNQTDATDVDSGFTVSTEVQGDGVGTVFVLTRTEDADNSPSNEVSGGMFVFVEDGVTCGSTGWVLSEPTGQAVLGTDDLIFTQFSGAGTVTAGIGLSDAGTTIDLDVDDLTTATVVAADIIAFHDLDGSAETSGSQTKKSTFQSVFNELDVPNAITSNGLITRTADDTYASRSIAVNGAGALDGLAVANGDGVAANPTIGLDIQNLPLRAAIDATLDRVAVWDSTTNTNVYYTVNDIAGAASASDSFKTWLGAGNTTGDASIIATSSTDTVTVTGGIGINVALTAASDIISWSFTRAGMADTAVVGSDTVAFFDASNSNEPEYRSWTNIISDLGLLADVYSTFTGDSGSASASGSDTMALIGATSGGITTVASEPGTDQITFGITPIDLATGGATLATGDFIIVSDSADTASTLALKYTFSDMIGDLGLLTAVTASALEDLTGIDVTGGSVIGLDILGLSAAGDDMSATDEFPLHDKSEGTAGANGKITGQDIADGVSTILGLPTLSTINGQPIWTYTDSTRTKTLSVESSTVHFGENKVSHLDWIIPAGNANDADSGHVMPLNGTVVFVTAHCEDTDGNSKDIHLFIEGVDQGSAGTLTGGANATFTNTTESHDFSQGDRIRVQAQDSGSGEIKDTVVDVTVRWRA